MQRLNKLLALLVAVTFLQCTSVTAVHGFTITEEREIGEKLLYSVRRAFPLMDDPDLVQYLTGLGKEVLQVAGMQYFDYRFYIINDKEFNAFAAPSGMVFFYAGLISKMSRENELVSVLAHEIGHVSKRHLAGRLEKGSIINVASVAVALAALALGGGAATQALMTGSLAAGQSAQLHFSRKDEEEADLLAYGWMKNMGRNPDGQRTMLQTMRRVSRYRSEKLPQYLLTHPNPEERLDYVQALMTMDQQEIGLLADKDNIAFLRFKYRIMAQTADAFSLREYLGSIAADSQASAAEKAMAFYGLSQVELQQRNFKAARAHLEKVRGALPDESVFLVDQGALLYQEGTYQEATTVLEYALKQRPKDMYAMFLLAKSYQIQNNLERAQALFTTVSYHLPEYSKVYFELGKMAALQQQRSKASLYQGKYHLLEGKNELAKFSLEQVVDDSSAPDKEVAEARQLLELIERLEE